MSIGFVHFAEDYVQCLRILCEDWCVKITIDSTRNRMPYFQHNVMGKCSIILTMNPKNIRSFYN